MFVFGEWREIAEKGHEDLVSQLRSVSPYARHPAPHRAAQFRPSTTWRKLTASALRKALPTLPASKASGNSQYRVPRILGTVCMLHNPLPSLKNGHSLFFLHGNLSRFWLVGSCKPSYRRARRYRLRSERKEVLAWPRILRRKLLFPFVAFPPDPLKTLLCCPKRLSNEGVQSRSQDSRIVIQHDLDRHVLEQRFHTTLVQK